MHDYERITHRTVVFLENFRGIQLGFELDVGRNPLYITYVMQVLISSKTIPALDKSLGHDLKGANPPRDNHCVQKSSPRDRTGSEKPHPWDIKLEISQIYL